MTMSRTSVTTWNGTLWKDWAVVFVSWGCFFLGGQDPSCYRRPSFPSQIDEIATPKWKINLIQEHENLLRCSWRV